MGHYSISDIVPFVCHSMYCSVVGKGTEEAQEFEMYLEPEELFGGWQDTTEHLEKICEEVGEDFDPYGFLYDEIHNNDWICKNKNRDLGWSDAISKRKRIGGFLYSKGKHKVWLINESEYSSAGVMELGVAAKDRASIKAFAKDWGLKALVINKDDTVVSIG